MTALTDARVLITGGAGFIGSTIADQLLHEGVSEVILLDNLVRGSLTNIEAALRDPRVRFVEGDIRNRSLLASLMAGTDVVFHQAALRITHCADAPREGFEVMATGTFNVIEEALAANVRKLVAASSASIYGMAEVFPTDEAHHPYDNRTFYGAAKLFLEGILRSFNDVAGLDYIALRYFNVYGPRMDIHGAYTEVLVRWMERLAAGSPPLILGDGLQTMDFVYVDDVARANVLAAKSDASDRVYNVATGVETSVRQLADALAAVMGGTGAPEYGPERKVNAASTRRLAATEAASRDLGFRHDRRALRRPQPPRHLVAGSDRHLPQPSP
ncbi:MAG: SDR family NAD(P)-dependent oxidoreductase [Acidimicrobiales bacterium]